MKQPSAFLAGDWYCRKCGDHQFSKNVVCRWCSTPKVQRADTERKGATSWWATSNKTQETDGRERKGVKTGRVWRSGLSSRDSASGAGGLQKDRWAREAVSDTAKDSNYSKQRRSHPHSKQPFKEGDWECTECGDHQFAKNEYCRSCYAPRTLWKQKDKETDSDQLVDSSVDTDAEESPQEEEEEEGEEQLEEECSSPPEETQPLASTFMEQLGPHEEFHQIVSTFFDVDLSPNPNAPSDEDTAYLAIHNEPVWSGQSVYGDLNDLSVPPGLEDEQPRDEIWPLIAHADVSQPMQAGLFHSAEAESHVDFTSLPQKICSSELQSGPEPLPDFASHCVATTWSSWAAGETTTFSPGPVPQGFQILLRNFPESEMFESAIYTILENASLEGTLTGISTRPGGKVLLGFSEYSEAMRCLDYFHDQVIGDVETPVSGLYVRTVKKDIEAPGQELAGRFSVSAPPFVPSWLSAGETVTTTPDDDKDESNNSSSHISTSVLSDAMASDDSCSEP